LESKEAELAKKRAEKEEKASVAARVKAENERKDALAVKKKIEEGAIAAKDAAETGTYKYKLKYKYI